MEVRNMKLGYVRVSSKDQNERRQVDALIEAGVDINCIYIDKVSGKNFDREQYKALLKAARPDDIIIVKSLDRFGRNYDEIRKQFKNITDQGIIINILDTPMLNTDQVFNGGLTMKFISDIILTVLGYVAEQERDNIHLRQKEGILSAKKSGIIFGRPTKINKDFSRIAEQVKLGELKTKEACEILKISRMTFYNNVKKMKN